MVDGEVGVTAPAATVPSDGTVDAGVVQPNPGDFDARVRQGGDFALEQVKNAQRELSRIKSKIGGVEPVVDAVGGSEALMAHLRRLNTLVSNPTMRSTIEEFERTGQLPVVKPNGRPNGAAEQDDDFEEPWTRDLSKSQQEIASLRAELTSLRGERGVEKVRENLTKFYEEFQLDDSDRSEHTEALIKQAQQWGQTAQGIEALKNTQDYTTFRTLALGKLNKEALWKARDREAQAVAGRRAAAATDVPSRIRTQANEQSGSLSPADAFIQACREVGHDPHRPLV